MQKASLIILSIFVLSACVSTSQSAVMNLGKTYPPKPVDSKVEILKSSEVKGPFEKIAKLEVYRESTFFAKPTHASAEEELKKQARLVGADAIIDEEHKTSYYIETGKYTLSGIAIHYTK